MVSASERAIRAAEKGLPGPAAHSAFQADERSADHANVSRPWLSQ